MLLGFSGAGFGFGRNVFDFARATNQPFVTHARCFRCTYVNYFTWGQILVFIFILLNALFSFPISAKLNFASKRYFMYQFFKWLNLTRIKSGLSVIIMFIISNAYIIALEKNNKKNIKCYKKYFIIPIKMLHNLVFLTQLG